MFNSTFSQQALPNVSFNLIQLGRASNLGCTESSFLIAEAVRGSASAGRYLS